MEKLENTRVQIDEIDDKIAELYNQRMRLVKTVAEEKNNVGLAINDGGRERAVISRVTKEVDEDKRIFTKQLFNTLFETSKAYQSHFVHQISNVAEQIKAVLSDGEVAFPQYATVACQGVEGSYSSVATEKLFTLSDITYVRDFEGVFSAVESGLCQYGVLPIENSSVGSVNVVYDLMKKHKFYVVKSIKIGVKHCLLAKTGATLLGIKEIYSHEQAIGQCREFIKSLGNVKVNIVENTAVASELVSKSDRLDIAAISSVQCAELYGLSVLKSNVQDNDNNYTRFICISKELNIFSNANKISLMVYLPHEAGSLHKLLSKFTALGLNLTKLESRPLYQSDFEFLFYFDFDADIKNPDVLNLLSELDNSTERFTFLGSYSEM